MTATAINKSPNLNKIIMAIRRMGYIEEQTAINSTYRLFTKKDKYVALHEITGYFAIFKAIERSFNPDIDGIIVDWTDEIELIV